MPHIMDFSKLCTPAMVYLVLAAISLVIALFKNFEIDLLQSINNGKYSKPVDFRIVSIINIQIKI